MHEEQRAEGVGQTSQWIVRGGEEMLKHVASMSPGHGASRTSGAVLWR